MRHSLFLILTALLLCHVLLTWFRLRRFLAGTTLLSAWNWGLATLCLWTVALGAETFGGIPPGLIDQCWYLTLLLILAAAMVVLGAKRPGARVWGAFVVLPMLCVLGWPAAYAWKAGWPPLELRLVDPALWAVLIVTVMGLGNYFGTQYVWSAGMLGGALLLLLAPLGSWGDLLGWNPRTCHLLSTWGLGIAALLGQACTGRASTTQPWDRVWIDFVNAFGIVWARRVQDRFNYYAREKQWGVELDFYGLTQLDPQTTPGEPPREAPWTPEMSQNLTWLLRRFVDPDWIARHVPP